MTPFHKRLIKFLEGYVSKKEAKTLARDLIENGFIYEVIDYRKLQEFARDKLAFMIKDEFESGRLDENLNKLDK